MVWTKLPRYFLALSLPLLLELAIIPGFLTTTRVQAQPSTQTTPARRRNRVTFQPRNDQPAPTITIGGGTRSSGKCPQDSQLSQQTSASKPQAQRLTPLLPLPRKNLPLTVSAHPTFLVYVPRTSAKAVEFSLLADKSEKEIIYQTTVKLTATPGIVSISLPSSVQPLEIGKDYRWIVLMNCQSEETGLADSPFTEGLVRRIRADSSLSQIDKAKPLEQVALYGKSGVWYEMLANLAALRKAQPNNPEVTSAWEGVLRDAGLEAIADAPLSN